MATRVAINGFGRIGRAFARRSWGRDIEIVAVNDLGSLENIAYLLKHDTVYGRAPFAVSSIKYQAGSMGKAEGALVIDGKEIPVFSEKDPGSLPWGELAVDVVVESTGFFTEYGKAQTHITAGARRAAITAPGKGDDLEGVTGLMGVNDDPLASPVITSNASCTTNAA